MKKIIFFLALITVLIACNKKQNTSTYVKDINKKKQDTNTIIKDPNFIIATSFEGKNSDSAFYYFNKVVTSSKDSFYIALSYNSMARMQFVAGDYFGNQENFISSLKFLNEQKGQDSGVIASNYNGLGLTTLTLKKYDSALSYFERALKFNENDALALWILNNKALIYQQTGNYTQSIHIYNDIISKLKNDPTQYARFLSNLAKTKWLQDPNYNAASEFLKALHIRVKENDFWGQNASYAHLADYYAKKRPDSALFYADKMYQIAKKLESPDDQIEALQKLIILSPVQKIKQYFERYQQLGDSIQTARNTAKNQFALIRYEVEKNKSDNLVLQKDNSEKKYQITIQWLVIAGVLVLIIALIFWYRKRRQRLELEAQNTIRESQLKTSKKVHDVVANGLYRVMTEIGNQDDIDKEKMLDKIEVLYEKSRDISYEDSEAQFIDLNFHEKIAALLNSFGTDAVKITISGNTRSLWKNVNANARYEIEHILQELMVNMDRHSNADHVTFRFKSEDNKITIHYADNGIGISEEKKFGNGLTNTGNRIKGIHGAITFETNTGDGLKIQISFPVS